MKHTGICHVFLLCAVLLAGVCPTDAAAVKEIDAIAFMTEQYPPFNFEKNGVLQGIAVDLLEKMLKEAGSTKTRKNFQLLPWARGYQNVQAVRNTCLFSTTRTREREKIFLWVGPIFPNKVVLTAEGKKNIVIRSTADIKKYRIGVIKDDVGEQLLLQAGIPASSLERVNSSLQNMKKLTMGRIDLWSYGEAVARWQIKEHGFSSNDFKTVYVLQSKDLYYAFHPSSDMALVRSLQQNLDRMKASGEYNRIVDGYLR